MSGALNLLAPRVRLIDTGTFNLNNYSKPMARALPLIHQDMDDVEIIRTLCNERFSPSEIAALLPAIKQTIPAHRADAFGVLTGGAA